MSSKLLFVSFLLSTLSVLGQNHSIGAMAGLSIATQDRENYPYYKYTPGILINGNYLYSKGKFITRTKLGFRQKGFDQLVIFVNEQGEVVGEGAREHHRSGFIGLSQFAGLQLGTNLRFTAMIGVELDVYQKTRVRLEPFTLNNGQIYEGYSTVYDNVSKIDYLAAIEAGVNYPFSNMLRVELVSSFHYSLVKRDFINFQSGDEWRNMYFGLELGFIKNI